jgi:hypothetical protein
MFFLFWCFTRLDDRGSVPEFVSLFANESRPALEPTSLLSKGHRRAVCSGIKRPGREVDHSSLSSAEVKNAWSFTSTPPLRIHTATTLPSLWCLKDVLN